MQQGCHADTIKNIYIQKIYACVRTRARVRVIKTILRTYQNFMFKTSTTPVAMLIRFYLMSWGCESNSRRIRGGWVTVKCAGMLLSHAPAVVYHTACTSPSVPDHAALPLSIGQRLTHLWLPLAGLLTTPIVSPPRLKRWTWIRRRREVGNHQCLAACLTLKTRSSWQLKILTTSRRRTNTVSRPFQKNVTLFKMNLSQMKYWLLKLTKLSNLT